MAFPYFGHCPRSRSMRNRVYETVERPFVCLSYRSTAIAACGGFAAERRADRRYRAGAGVQQQRRRSTAFSSKCGQCRVDIGGSRLNTNLVLSEIRACFANRARVRCAKIGF